MFCLLDKLLKRRIPIQILNILFIWFASSTIVVKWGNCLSNYFVLRAGVRQGGALSPFLFAVYVDELLVVLHKCGLGCCYKGVICNAFMYADDLVLITASLTHLQRLIEICIQELSSIGLCLNANKSNIIRVGKRYRCVCNNVFLADNVIKFCNELR